MSDTTAREDLMTAMGELSMAEGKDGATLEQILKHVQETGQPMYDDSWQHESQVVFRLIERALKKLDEGKP